MPHWMIECTPFPFASLPNCMDGVRKLAERSGGDHLKAIDLVDEDIRKAMENPLPADE